MATITKQSDGDLSLGNLRGELVNLQPSVSDYASGGYLVEGIGGATESVGNVGMDKILGALPFGGQGGFVPVFNPTTSKVQIFEQSAATSALTEIATTVNLSTYTFALLLVGL